MSLFPSLPRKKAQEASKQQKHINTPMATETPTANDSGYSVVNAEEANFAKIKRYNYRIVVARGLTDAHLLRIFKELDNRTYDEVTVWCYADREEINRCQPYTVAMIERTAKHTAPHIMRR